MPVVMINEDVLRRAVELAEGWYSSGGDYYCIVEFDKANPGVLTEELIERLLSCSPVSESEQDRDCHAAGVALEAKDTRIAELETENERLRAAIVWALGYTDFGCHKPDNAKPFWWRKELRERSGITHEQALAAVGTASDE